MSNELRELIRSTAEEYPFADPLELAHHVAKLTPKHSLHDFYVEALNQVVSNVLGESRRNAFKALQQPQPQPRPGNANHSPKLAQRRDWWAELLRQRVPVGHVWKVIGECTADDLQACIAEREKHIAGFRLQIANFAHLQALLHKHDVRTVAELPPQEKWIS